MFVKFFSFLVHNVCIVSLNRASATHEKAKVSLFLIILLQNFQNVVWEAIYLQEIKQF